MWESQIGHDYDGTKADVLGRESVKKPRLIQRLFSLYIMVAIAAIVVIVLFASQAVEKFYFDQKIDDLRIRSILIEETIWQLDSLDQSSLQQFIHDLGHKSLTRITLLDGTGEVRADSQEDPAVMDNHSDRPEVIMAMRANEGTNLRWSYTLEQEYLYYARSLQRGNRFAIVRVSVPTQELYSALESIKLRLSLIGVFVIVLFAALNWYVSGVITRPIQLMEAGAKRFAAGKFKLKLPESNIQELSSLAKSLNNMSEQIFDRIKVITRQKNEQIAILTSMSEGVIALGSNMRILSTNRAAAVMFGLKPKQIKGRPIYEVIRHAALNEFVNAVLNKKKSQECRITVYEPEERILNLRGSRMPSKKGAEGGVLIVLADLTRVQKLEGVRREFVANVSHELKTPITSIQGYVETLRDGALDNPEDAKQFLSIISEHSDRLGQIVDDLLVLSRIEELRSGEDELKVEGILLMDLVDVTLQNYIDMAHKGGIQLKKEIDPSCRVKVNPKLMSLALGNLLSNAIKYSKSHSEVWLKGHYEGKHVILEVVDQGPGIAPEHVSRIFERFYRVDKGRSRDIGGTGLGLSIVKHIVQIHQMNIQVDSNQGTGSTFRIIF